MRKNPALLEIVAGICFGGVLVSHFLDSGKDFGQFGLGDKTSTYQARDGSWLTHVIKSRDEEESSLLAGWESRGRRPVCLLLGYSQAHAINEFKPGDATYSQLLFDRHKDDSPPIDILCQSLPNATVSEYYALFAYWSERLPVKVVVLPACLDKMRNVGLREQYLENLGFSDFQITGASDPLTLELNGLLASLPKRNSAGETSNHSDNAALEQTVQEAVEKLFNEWLTSCLPMWSRRGNARGEIFQWLYLFRNSVLGIDSNTKRRVIPASYNENMKALENLLARAERVQTRVLVYIPPVRFDLPSLYDAAQYTQYKTDVQALVEKSRNATYLNIESIVPGAYWGDLPPTDLSGRRQPDFMHFKYEGHKLTADALDPIIARMIRQ